MIEELMRHANHRTRACRQRLRLVEEDQIAFQPGLGCEGRQAHLSPAAKLIDDANQRIVVEASRT